MARFGKMAALAQHKSTKAVPCIVSWAENACSGSDDRGGYSRYYVEIQRYQGDVSEEDARAGNADSNPYIVNKRVSYKIGGTLHNKIDHQTPLYSGAMEAIMGVSQGDIVMEKQSIRSAFAQATAEVSGKKSASGSEGVRVHHYFVKLNVGFGNNEAFVYIPKANVLGNPAGRNMPLPAGELTQEMLERHNRITQISKEVAQSAYAAKHAQEETVDEGAGKQVD